MGETSRISRGREVVSVGNISALQVLVGPEGRNLAYLSKRMGVRLSLKGNDIVVEAEDLHKRQETVLALQRIESYLVGHPSEEDPPFDLLLEEPGKEDEIFVRTYRKVLRPRNLRQVQYVQAIEKNDIVFCQGVAGTGKTFLAIAKAVSLLKAGRVERLVLSRPAVEAGENLGFLPGDLKEKVDPYMRPIYDALRTAMSSDMLTRNLESGVIEVAPLAFMRGRTLDRAFVLLDEAQNTTPVQMKMFLTRMGEGSKIVVAGDGTQVDLPAGQESGLHHAFCTLGGIADIGFVHFQHRDIVRHPLVTKIVEAYDALPRS